MYRHGDKNVIQRLHERGFPYIIFKIAKQKSGENEVWTAIDLCPE